MTDIVERLRVNAWRSDGWNRQDAAEAADEIERLRAERDAHRNKVGDQILRREKALLVLGTVMIVTFLIVLFAHFFGLIGAPQETRP